MLNKALFEKNFSILNPEQKEAVESMYGPVIVVAWPGTGKTQIIWLRTAYILQNTDTSPENILITTFTEAWVIAIKKRLLDFIWEEAYKVQVTTIHSFCEDVIKSFPEEFIEYKLNRVIDEIETIQIFEWIIDDGRDFEILKNVWNPYFYLSTIKMRISQLKQEGVSPEKFLEIIENQKEIYKQELDALASNKRIRDLEKRRAKDKEVQDKHIKKLQELHAIYLQYNNVLHQKEAYDFNDMINWVLDNLKKNESMCYHYAEKFQFIMLDEFQDTNNAQNQIFDSILAKSEDEPNIMVVWDDDQSIYRFQWANIENLLWFFSKYPSTKVVVLKFNYRSIQPILDVSTNLIEKNAERITNRVSFINKELFSWRKDYKQYEDTPVNISYPLNDIEEKILIKKLLEEKTNNWIEPNTIAIITRSNAEIKDWSEYLLSNWINVESKLKSNILESPYVEFIVNILWFYHDPYFNDDALISMLCSDILEIDNLDVYTINNALYRENYTKKYKIKLIEYLIDEEKLVNLNLHNYSEIENFMHKYKELLWLQSHLSFRDFFQKIIENYGVIEFIEENGTFDDLQDVFTFFEFVKRQINWNNSFDWKDLLSSVGLHKKYKQIIKRLDSNKNSKWIQLLTAHWSKWLEFNTVFIPWVNYWNWDWKRSVDLIKLPNECFWDWLQYSWLDAKEISTINKSKTKEEDRRLFFVALTRAEKELYISIPGAKESKVLLPSSFIEEIKTNEHIQSLNTETIITEAERKTEIELMLKKSVKPIWLQSDFSKELIFIEDFLENYKLSPSDLNKFLEDPAIFLKEAIFKYPFVDNVFTIFWKVYHRVLELFFLEYKKTSLLPSEDFLIKMFEILLKREVLTPEEYTDLLEKWREWLSWYYKTYNREFTEPLFLEYNFRHKNVIFDWIPVTWKIDKIEISVNAGQIMWEETQETWSQMAFFKESVKLIDFKTWRTKSLWVIKWLDKYGNKKPWFSDGKYYRQLLFYKLLCEQDREFNSLYDVTSLELDFVEWKDKKYKCQEVEFTDEDYDQFKTLLKDSWEKINSLSFWKDYLWS